MLDANDLKAIAKLLDEKLDRQTAAFDEKLDRQTVSFDEKLDRQTAAFDEKLDRRFSDFEEKMDRRFAESENMILEELSRDREYLEKQIFEVRKDIERLEQYSGINRLENENMTLVMQMIGDLQREMEELKNKIA